MGPFACHKTRKRCHVTVWYVGVCGTLATCVGWCLVCPNLSLQHFQLLKELPSCQTLCKSCALTMFHSEMKHQVIGNLIGSARFLAELEQSSPNCLDLPLLCLCPASDYMLAKRLSLYTLFACLYNYNYGLLCSNNCHKLRVGERLHHREVLEP